eukprot:s635_g29.t1
MYGQARTLDCERAGFLDSGYPDRSGQRPGHVSPPWIWQGTLAQTWSGFRMCGSGCTTPEPLQPDSWRASDVRERGRLNARMIPNPQCRGVGGLGGLGGPGGPGFGLHNTIRGNAEANPEYVPSSTQTDEQGNVTLIAWASFLPAEMSGKFGQASAWPTEVFLPRNGQIQILEAWYGHPSDPSRRIDVSERVSEFLRGPGPMGAGLANLVREGCYRGDQVRLEATSSFWGQDPAPFVWKKLMVRYRSPSH